jgi:4-amino-4-deoxy-L-arabinose transferase-like glycosyltransferase
MKTLSLLFLFLCGVCVFFWGLDAYGLLHNNEGLYAQIPREMLERSNYIIPHLNGVPYIEKPPLLYWLILSVYKLFGVSVWSARFVPASAGLATCLGLYLFMCQQKNPQSGFWAALVLMSFGAFSVFSRMVYFDGLLTFWLTSALLSFYQGQQTLSKKLLSLSYGLLACAVLTKGFVALILYGLVISTWILITGKWRMIPWLFSPVPLSIFLLILCPWHVMAHKQDPDFSYFYFINEHILRFLGKRQPQDYYHGPIYYYIPRLLLYGLPWTLVAYQSLKKVPASPLKTFLSIWIGVCFIFFSLSQAKANYYIITLLPPLALLLALGWQQKPSFVKAAPLLFALIGIGAGIYGAYKGYGYEPCGVFIGIFVLCAWVYFKKDTYTYAPFLFLLQTFVLIILALQLVPRFEKDISAKGFSNLPEHACLYRDFEKMSSVVFYANRPLPIYRSLSNDLLYGLNHVPSAKVTLGETLKRCPAFFVFHEQKQLFNQEFPLYQEKETIGKVTLFTKTP